jgi:uncharacterized protein YukE
MTQMLSVLLERCARELREAAEDNAHMEGVVQGLLAHQDHSFAATGLIKLQGMDLLTQRIADLARFLEQISPVVRDIPVNMEHAQSTLHLRDLRDRLAGREVDVQSEAGWLDEF